MRERSPALGKSRLGRREDVSALTPATRLLPGIVSVSSLGLGFPIHKQEDWVRPSVREDWVGPSVSEGWKFF